MKERLKDWWKQYGCNLIEWLPVLGLFMLVSAIPFGWSDYQRVCLIVLGVGYVLDYVVSQRWLQIGWNKSKWIYVVMLFLWVLPYVRQLFDSVDATAYFHYQMHCHEWFAYVGVIGLLGFSPKLRMHQVAWVMLLTSVVMAVYCAYLYCCTDMHVDLGTTLIRFDALRREQINSHMVMNLYINTAIILGLYSLETTEQVWKKIVMVICMGIGLALIFLSAGRIGQGTALIILMAYFFYRMRHLNKLWYVAVVAFLGLCVWGVLHLNKRFNPQVVMEDPRFAIWNYSMRKIQQKPIVGFGYSSLDIEYLEPQYTDSIVYTRFVEHLMNVPDFAIQGKTLCTHHPHNGFMLYWLAMGLAGLFGLLCFFVASACMPVNKGGRFYLMLFLVALFIQCMTEPIGGHLLPQFFCIVLFVWQRTSCTIALSLDHP